MDCVRRRQAIIGPKWPQVNSGESPSDWNLQLADFMEQRPALDGPDLFVIQSQRVREHRRKSRDPFAATPRPRVLPFERPAPSLNRGLQSCLLPRQHLPQNDPDRFRPVFVSRTL